MQRCVDDLIRMDRLRDRVQRWFDRDALDPILLAGGGHAEAIALDWMSRAGKRLRPFMAACVYSAIEGCGDLPADLRVVAVAGECFHKASLIHDDIEDGHDRRYHRKSLHAEHGVAVALNVGDLLVGKGYSLLAGLKVDRDRVLRMIDAASAGHLALCAGQGIELSWWKKPHPPSVAEVLDVFGRKTGPAFEVALTLGAILAGVDDELIEVLARYSHALGVAYQIRDDADDFESGEMFHDAGSLRPSVFMALAWDGSTGQHSRLLASIWDGSVELGSVSDRLRSVFTDLDVPARADRVLLSYLQKAAESAARLKDPALGRLLENFLTLIFGTAVNGQPAKDSTTVPIAD